MIKFITACLLFNGLAWSQESEPSTGSPVREKDTKFNWSIGLLDDRTGLSLMGITYNLMETDKDELFVGAGTMLFAFTATTGWKHYYRKSKFSISSVLCGQKIAHIGFAGYMPTISFTMEYRLTKRAHLKFGGLGLGKLLGGTSDELGPSESGFSDVELLPFVGLNFRLSVSDSGGRREDRW